ncbi:hypothetical protein R5R40_09285 [Oenococcus oeni]
MDTRFEIAPGIFGTISRVDSKSVKRTSKGGLTGKQKKAQEKLQKGQNIRTITESVFLDMLNEDRD